MISSVLIANRGEIARRVMRTARRMGVRTIAVYSAADAKAAHVREADVAILIGPASASESYLSAQALLAAAEDSNAEAIHPGYGFLSESAEFAEAVMAAGRIWIGPPPAAIRAMGLKDAAKRLMRDAGVPVTPGYLGEDQSEARLAQEAAQIGWPVLIKAVAGGGGKGMRKVTRAADFAAALASARREAAAAFGDDRVLLETYVARPRHIEVQVFADSHGHVVHLFERDCSIQRRHQKVIEEAPAPGLGAEAREALCAAAVKAARAVDYRGAGTVEFIADASAGLRADRIWFMEMNTRLQVEHPVTEAITGVDLVEWQFRVAAGEPLPLTQSEVGMRGHAIEARLYAEDPASGFLPSTGPLSTLVLPADVRVDTAVESGDVVTPYYDPLLAKLIAHGGDREAARRRLAAAVADVRAWPVKTNAWFVTRCLADADFTRGEVDTGFVESRLDGLTARPVPSSVLVAAVVGDLALETPAGTPGAGDPWRDGAFGFRLNGPAKALLVVGQGNLTFEASLEGGTEGAILLSLADEAFEVSRDGPDAVTVSGVRVALSRAPDGGRVGFEGGAAFVFHAPGADADEAKGGGDGVLRAPMPGRIVQVVLQDGEVVAAGETVLILEAMKMEHALKAPFDGVIENLAVAVGDQVVEGAVLARLAPATPDAA